MTALLLAGKGRVVAEKRATRSTVKVPFPLWLNTRYNSLTELHTPIITHKVFSSQPDFQLSTLATNFFLHSLPYRTELRLALSLAYNIPSWTT
jgi:hypothetical protein